MSYPPSTPPPPPPRPTNPGPSGPGRLYSVVDLATEWSCSTRHVYNLISRGELAVVDIGHGKAKTRIPAGEVARYIAANTRKAPKGRAA